MRNISFFLTTDQVQTKTKTVTRRHGWWHLKQDEILQAVVKCQGLKKGEKIDKICQLKEGNDPDADPKDSISIDRAKAINDSAKEIINIAKVKVDAIKIMANSDNLITEDILKQSGVFQLKKNND